MPTPNLGGIGTLTQSEYQVSQFVYVLDELQEEEQLKLALAESLKIKTV